MEGVTSLAMRLWFSLVSQPETMGTPFLRVTESFPLKELPWDYIPELTILKPYLSYRVIPQMMSVNAEEFMRAADLFSSIADFIELNCGCPSHTCVGKGA